MQLGVISAMVIGLSYDRDDINPLKCLGCYAIAFIAQLWIELVKLKVK